MAFNPGPNKTQVVTVDNTGAFLTLAMGHQQCRVWNRGPGYVSLTFGDTPDIADNNLHQPPNSVEVYTKILLTGMSVKTVDPGSTALLHIIQGAGD